MTSGATWKICPMRPSRWFQCRRKMAVFLLQRQRRLSETLIKITAGAVILTLIIYIFQLPTPLTSVPTSDTPLRWFPSTTVANKSLHTERRYNKPNKYLINPQNVCLPHVPIDYLFLVFSAAGHAEARQAIRHTWAGDAKRSSRNRVLFLFGKPSTAKLQSALEIESQRYGDIVQENFWDAYRNLSLKAVMMLRWATLHCPQARFLVKIDDDSLPNLSNFYMAMDGKFEDSIYGEIRHGSIPQRNRNSKWYIPYEDFPKDVAPDFITGGMYVIGGRVVGLLYRTTGHVKPFLMEDMFLTGMCAERAGVARRHLFGAYDPKMFSPCDSKTAIYAHPVAAGEVKDLLNATKSLQYKCHRLFWGIYVCYCGTSDSST
ncbi:beta-1,3-galactosyltransferase 5-like [Dermacentor variabilis]|uniref:beta-1,3-galactosyltransferase 5-like n=1 Tax=Dermacentor variabilis TaxID=34621 RepID=UPI003F5AF9B4